MIMSCHITDRRLLLSVSSVVVHVCLMKPPLTASTKMAGKMKTYLLVLHATRPHNSRDVYYVCNVLL